MKDGVCDRMRDEHGERPNVDTVRPDLQIVLHVGAERAAIYVDSSGESLFKRGWREDKGDAPLKETLAAAMLAAAGWHGTAEAAARCTTRAAARARSPSRRPRSRWGSHRAACAASPSSGCCRSRTPSGVPTCSA